MAYFEAVSYWTVLHQGWVIAHAKLLKVELYFTIVALYYITLSVTFVAGRVESKGERFAQAYFGLYCCLYARYSQPEWVAFTAFEFINELSVREHSHLLSML